MMNRSVVKLFAMSVTAAALAVSAVQANASQWLGEGVPFDAAADEPQPIDSVPGSADHRSDSTTRADASKFLGEHVPFDATADDAPRYTAFESNYPEPERDIAGLPLDQPVDSYSEFAFPSMPDFSFDEPQVMVASFDPLDTP
jgi:hypothetical protein